MRRFKFMEVTAFSRITMWSGFIGTSASCRSGKGHPKYFVS
jgi:hypothetical protein